MQAEGVNHNADDDGDAAANIWKEGLEEKRRSPVPAFLSSLLFFIVSFSPLLTPYEGVTS